MSAHPERRDLAERLKAEGLQQADAARLLGISESFLSKIVNGKASPGEETERRIGALLATPPGLVRPHAEGPRLTVSLFCTTDVTDETTYASLVDVLRPLQRKPVAIEAQVGCGRDQAVVRDARGTRRAMVLLVLPSRPGLAAAAPPGEGHVRLASSRRHPAEGGAARILGEITLAELDATPLFVLRKVTERTASAPNRCIDFFGERSLGDLPAQSEVIEFADDIDLVDATRRRILPALWRLGDLGAASAS